MDAGSKAYSLICWVTVIFVCFYLLCACGRAPFDRQYHRVTKVINGNTLELNNRVTVHLIGVENNTSGEQFLREQVLGKNVRVRFDRTRREAVSGSRPVVYGYVLTHDRLSVNAELLKRNYAELNIKYLSDSLEAFTNYVLSVPSSTAHQPRPPSASRGHQEPGRQSLPSRSTERQTPAPEATDLGQSPVAPTFPEIVREVSKAVFMLYTFDDNNRQLGFGTGFFIDPNGIGLSNHHVTERGSRWIAKISEDEYYEVIEIIDYSSVHDYIRFRVNSERPVSYLKINHEIPYQGTDIFVLGNPKGLERTLTRGVVSAIRSINSPSDFLQIDAAISPGSSGSPVLTMEGKVVGIATGAHLDCEACNFAVNIQIALQNMN